MTARRTHLIRDHHGQGAITTACGRDAYWSETKKGGHFQVYHCANDDRVVDIEATNMVEDITCRKCIEAERVRHALLTVAVPQSRHECAQ